MGVFFPEEKMKEQRQKQKELINTEQNKEKLNQNLAWKVFTWNEK